VTDPIKKTPAAAEAKIVTELMKDRGVIAFPNGIHDNVMRSSLRWCSTALT